MLVIDPHSPNTVYAATGNGVFSITTTTPENYTFRVAGTVTDGTNPLPGVTLTFSHNGHQETTASDGTYAYMIPTGTTTTITPSKTGYTRWAPASITLPNITGDRTGQDFSGTADLMADFTGAIAVFLDNAKKLRKINANGNVSRVLNYDPDVNQIQLDDFGNVYIVFTQKHLVDGSQYYLMVRANLKTNAIVGVDQSLAAMVWNAADVNPSIQLDSNGNVYYMAQVGGNTVLRKYVSETNIIDLSNDNITVHSWSVKPDGVVVLSGETLSTQTRWLRKISASGVASNIASPGECNWVLHFPNDRVYAGIWGPSPYAGTYKLASDLSYLTNAAALTPYIGIAGLNGLAYQPDYDALAVASGHDSFYCQGFTTTAGAALASYVETANGAIIGLAGATNNRTLVKLYPTPEIIDFTMIDKPTVFREFQNKLIVAGTKDGINKLILYDLASKAETSLLTEEIEIYHLDVLLNGSILFDGLKFNGLKYVVGLIEGSAGGAKGGRPNSVFAGQFSLTELATLSAKPADFMVLNSGSQSASVMVESPNGAENLAIGSICPISWSAVGSFANVRIEYSVNSGADWSTVTESTANTGVYNWAVPNTPSTTCLIRVSDAANAIVYDVSNAFFTISAGFSVTFHAGSHGTLTGTATQTVVSGGTTTPITAVANPGYHFVNWTGTGGFSTSTSNPLVIAHVTADMTVSANFAEGSPTLAIGSSHSRLNFSKVGNALTAAQSLRISSTGYGTLNWTATPNKGWIVLDKTSGSGNGRVQVSVNATGLGNGTYNGTITVTDTTATNSPLAVQISLVVKNAGANPFGTFETPAAGATGVAGNIAVTGWALDDVEVTSVKIYRSPLAGEGSARVFIGDANLVEGARPDVEALNASYPWSYRSGWGYMMLTNFLPNGGNGPFTIHAVATDREGHSVTLGSKTITCDNAHATLPFGTIDTPEQGGTITGSSYVNFGWALTPLPASIPTNGSTINVWVDGAPVGHPTYDQYRVDIATLFPGYTNSDGAVGFFYLNPSTLAEGAHSIAWSVEDSLGRLDGIGSRYFSVEHMTGGMGAGTSQDIGARIYPALGIAIDTPMPMRVRQRFAALEQTIYPDRDGIVIIKAKMGEPLEIELDPDRTGSFSGLERVGDDLRLLPAGSNLDAKTGIFTWLPGPGFRGEFTLEFTANLGNETILRHQVKVRIE